MTTATTIAFDLDVLTVSQLAKVARILGEKGDFEARVKKAEIIRLINTHVADRLDTVEGALRHIGCDDEDIENLRITDEDFADDDEPIPAKQAIELLDAEPDDEKPAKQKKQAKAAQPAQDENQVAQIAALLAQVLATNKGALDVDQVAAIAKKEVMTACSDLAEQLGDIGAKNYAAILDMVEKKLSDMPARKIEVTFNGATHEVEGRQHMQFEELLYTVGAQSEGESGMNVWLAGAAGTGKTTAASNVAKALGMEFYTNGSIANKYELTGFVDAHGKLVRTPFRDAWENGGLYLFDEVDGSVPSALLAFNAALANGIMAFPDGMIKRHEKCIIIAAANTFGNGATAEYVGRMKQDFAFLDRFVFMHWKIDEALELHFSENKEWAQYVQRIRKTVEAKGLKVIVTPRATIFGSRLLRSGKIPRERVIEMTLKKGMSDDQWNMVK